MADHPFAADFAALPITAARKPGARPQQQKSYGSNAGRGQNSRRSASSNRGPSASRSTYSSTSQPEHAGRSQRPGTPGSYSHLAAAPAEIASRPEAHHASAQATHDHVGEDRPQRRRRRSRNGQGRDRMPV